MTTEKLNLFQKINMIQKEVTSVIKDATISVGNDSYNVVTHDAVTSALHLPLANAGVVCIPTTKSCTISEIQKEKVYNGNKTVQTIYRADVIISACFINSDNPQENFVTEMHAYAFDTSDKAVGKAVSMAIKNTYLKIFMLESCDQEESRIIEQDVKYKQNIKNEAPQTQEAAKKWTNPTR